jgi:hypothetical protein
VHLESVRGSLAHSNDDLGLNQGVLSLSTVNSWDWVILGSVCGGGGGEER